MSRQAIKGQVPGIWFLLLGMALLLIAGPLHAAPGGEGLAGSAWRLVNLPGTSLLPGVTVSLLLGQQAASGSDGCNRYSLPYAIADDTVRFRGQAITTQMACAQERMQLADAFHAALRLVDSGRVEGDRLVFRDGGGSEVAVFVRQDLGLTTSPWTVTGYNNGRGGVVSLLGGTALTLHFDEDGRLAGSAGCNRFMTTYASDGDAIRIEPAATTRRLCAEPDGIMQQETAFLAALARAETVSVFDDRLELRDPGGALQVDAMRPGPAPGRP